MGLLCILITAGCTNQRDSLQLEIAPNKKAYAANEPVQIDAIFISTSGATCIHKPWAKHFDVKLENLDSGEVIQNRPIGFCGTPYVWLAPLTPFLLAGACLDSGNLGNRFVVVDESHCHKVSYRIRGSNGGFVIMNQDKQDVRFQAPGRLATGRYRLDMTLPGGPYRGNPVPLFWSVYKQPASASTEFEVLPEPTVQEN